MEHIPFMKYQHILPSVEVDKGSVRIAQEKEPSTAGTDNFRDRNEILSDTLFLCLQKITFILI